MTDVAVLIADMVRAGVDPDLIGRTAAALSEREPVKIVDEQAERRRAADRERKRLRNSAESAETLSLDKETPPTPPKEIKPNPIPPSPPKGGSSPAGFGEFWAGYPHKVGKRDAEKAFERALKRVDLTELMAGLARYVAKTDDRPWCNPSTWLNQDRWTDQPAQAQPRASPSQPGRGNAAEAARRRLQELQNDRRRSGTEVDDYQSAPRLISSNG